MSTVKFPYQDLKFYSKLIKDYLDQEKSVEDLYHRFPRLENFKEQIVEKKGEWSGTHEKRAALRDVLVKQYLAIDLGKDHLVSQHIQLLKEENTFTVTTGHQLNLFTGPLYFLYKIASTINLCKQLKAKYPQENFIPIYWMATEDHDFEEIQYFNFGDRKLVYERESHGAVGRLNTDGLEGVSAAFSNLLSNNTNAEKLKDLFKDSYTKHEILADATRYLAHEIFGDQGLVIIDADNVQLKSFAQPYFKTDLINNLAFKKVNETMEQLTEDYSVQVNPREINLFYLTDDHRGRIIKKEVTYHIDGTDLKFSEQELLQELKNHPERFSPNVILRPLYQEIILPNLCYIGGGGEIAYWLELKSFFDASDVVFPILLLRNSAQLITQKQVDKASRLDLNLDDLFKEDFELEELVVKQVSEIKIDFSKQIEHLKDQFSELYDIASKTEKSFETAVAAQQQKQINGLEHLEKRLLKAQKRKLASHIERAIDLQKEMLPAGNLQERVINFSFFQQHYGSELVELIMQSLDPLDLRFTFILLDD
jgi:bacillithiol biosynthesis cysteine-adding enzyme BshC